MLEEGAPAEAEFRREAEVVKQVRESDVEHEARPPTNAFDLSQAVSALSSPNMINLDTIDEPEEDLMRDLSTGLSSGFKQQMLKSKSKSFWDTFSECSSTGGGGRASPPPQPFMPHESSSGMSEDAGMDSPSFPLFQSYPVRFPCHTCVPYAAPLTKLLAVASDRDRASAPVCSRDYAPHQ